MTQTIEFTTVVPGTFRVTFDVAFEPKPDDHPPPPPPPPVATRKALECFKVLSQPIGSPLETTTRWAARTIIRTRIPFQAVQLLFVNPGYSNALGHSVPRTISNHMVASSATITRSPPGWQRGNADLIVPGSPHASAAQRPGYALGDVISLTPVPATDGGAPIVVLSGDMLGAVWHAAPDGFDASSYAGYPDRPLMSWRAYGVQTSTPETANAAASWIDMPGSQTVAGLLLHHASAHAGLFVYGDSIDDGGLNLPGVCNYLSYTYRAANLLAADGVILSYGRMSQGGAKWADMDYKLNTAIAQGIVGPGMLVGVPTFTPNDSANATQHWANSQAHVALVQAAGATPILLGPMPSNAPDSSRNAIRSQMLASPLHKIDVGAVVGTSADPSVYAEGMCGDPSTRGVHPSPAANAALAVAFAAVVRQIIG